MSASRTLRWLVPGVAVGVIGCGGSSPPPEPAVAVPVIVAPAEPDDTKPTTQATEPAKPVEQPVTLPDDTGGKAVAKALVVPPAFPADPPTVSKPKPYFSDVDRGETPLPPVSLRPFAPITPAVSSAKPSPPRERHQPGTAVTTLPESRASERPLVKAPSPPNPRAADVPMQAWKQGDRASVDDPTADLCAVRVIETPLPVLRGQLPFLRMSIPDPFELVEHLKGKLGKDTELGTGPIK